MKTVYMLIILFGTGDMTETVLPQGYIVLQNYSTLQECETALIVVRENVKINMNEHVVCQTRQIPE